MGGGGCARKRTRVNKGGGGSKRRILELTYVLNVPLEFLLGNQPDLFREPNLLLVS